MLSTCNRFEVYGAVEDVAQGQQLISTYLAKIGGVPGTQLAPHLQMRQDRAAITHLCQVASGMDSMILGEVQIQGQVAQAHQIALASGTAGMVVDAVFRTALRAGKRARSETNIARHAVSISHAAVELALQIFDDLTHASVLLIGAGEMAELAAENLVDRGVGKLTVVNRSVERAANLAERFGGRAVRWKHLGQALWDTDIVISSTSAPHAVLTADMVSSAMRLRHNRYLLIIDIAVPRDVEPAVGDLVNVYLYDIDSLQQVVDANLEQRKREVPRVQAIIDQEVDAFVAWFRALDVVPAIVDLRNHIEGIREAETRWALGKLGHLSDRERKVVLALSRRIVNKILHHPTVRLKEHAGSLDHQYVAVLRELFGLNPMSACLDEKRPHD